MNTFPSSASKFCANLTTCVLKSMQTGYIGKLQCPPPPYTHTHTHALVLANPLNNSRFYICTTVTLFAYRDCLVSCYFSDFLLLLLLLIVLLLCFKNTTCNVLNLFEETAMQFMIHVYNEPLHEAH